MKLIIATHNAGKLAEFRTLLAPLGFDVKSADELNLPEPEETGTTFEANAELKARAAAVASGLPALADDSGLVIPALDGAPGVYSARWAPGKDFNIAFERIKRELGEANAPHNTPAHFICVLALALPKSPPLAGGYGGEPRPHYFGQQSTSTRLLPTLNIAKMLRKNMTKAEWKLWEYLSANKLEDFKFRRQQAISNYIVDFVCMEAKLIVEVDGSQHMDSKTDEKRDKYFQSLGYRILRFWNNEVLENVEGVVTIILNSLREPFPPESPRLRGEQVKCFTGRIDGTLAFPPRGTNGFGYDPIFIPEGYTQTFAELPTTTKNALSHRARALDALKHYLASN